MIVMRPCNLNKAGTIKMHLTPEIVPLTLSLSQSLPLSLHLPIELCGVELGIVVILIHPVP